jgi:hypothetical protein
MQFGGVPSKMSSNGHYGKIPLFGMFSAALFNWIKARHTTGWRGVEDVRGRRRAVDKNSP